MKNFSVKTADFDSLSISGEAPIVQSDVGTAPNQIPLNKDLGSLAYMNAPQIEDLNVDTLELREIAAELSDTAVDVFVYDTRKDSDGGAWRERTQNTSWYNEELNTATRGGRREFPAVAVIVAESNKVTIYDGDDPDLSMWMVFDDGGNSAYLMTRSATCISAINGSICAGCDDNNNYGHILYVNFISDIMQRWSKQDGYTESYRSGTGISTRNGTFENILDTTTPNLVNKHINDVAMTVLPNAPIDADTGLPIPTIAVATDGGVSVIKDDGSVVDLYGNASYTVASIVGFTKDFRIINNIGSSSRYLRHHNIPTVDTHVKQWTPGADDGITFFLDTANGDFVYVNADDPVRCAVEGALGNDSGLTIWDENKEAPTKSLVSYTTSTYNTGWMPGDIKLATLSDTKIETVGVDESTELIANNDFSSPINESDGVGWDLVSGTQSIDVGVLTIQPTTYGGVEQIINVLPNKKYIFNVVVHATTTGTARIYLGDSSSQGAYYNEPSLTAGAYNFEFTTSSDTVLKIKLATTSESGSNVSFSSTSLKQTGELITNGTFDDGTAGWTAGTGATISVDSATTSLKVEQGTSDFAACSQPINTIVGKKYTISFDLLSDGNSSVSAGIYVRSSQFSGGSNIISAVSNSAFGSQSATFTAIGSVTYIEPGMTSSADNIYGLFDNISVRLAEDDRSANDNGLQIFGEIDKTPVAPGADLVAYSGFSAENYLMQPYNSDLDFGTGDLCFIAWVYPTGTSHGGIISRGGNGVYGPYRLNYADNFITFMTSSDWNELNGLGSWGTLIQTEASTVPPNKWSQVVATLTETTAKVYINGSLAGTDNSIVHPKIPITNFIPTTIGAEREFVSGSIGKPFPGSLALIRASATAPTDEQIAKIYRDEKVLFTDGAQATLYGTSDAVTALAYDDSENLLHVGTASGRSVFNGLKRVDNTTTAVSTAISATEGLVIEQ